MIIPARNLILALILTLAWAACSREPAPAPDRSERLLEQGDRALTAGNLVEAERHFGEAIAADPNSARSTFGLGLARLRQGRAADALANFQEATRLAPDNTHYAYLRAHTLARLGRRDEAIAAYRSLIEAHPEQIQATLEMLSLLSEAGRLDDARVAVLKALERAPRNFGLLMTAGRILGLSGAHEGSIEHYSRAREIRPYAPQPVYGLIEAYRNTGRVKEGGELIQVFEGLQARAADIETLRTEAAKNPSDPQPVLRYIERLFAEGHLDEAVEAAVDFVAQFPALPETGPLAIKAARSAVKLGNFDSARELLHAAEMGGDRTRQEFLVLAETHEGLGEYTEALALYDRYLQERPDDPNALLGMGRTAMHAGQIDLAEAPLKRALALKPKDAAAHAALGLLKVKTGDSNGAATELQAALKHDPNHPDALFGLGFLAHQRRNNDEAEKYLVRALKSRPGDPGMQVVLALVLSETDRCAEAIPMFTRALEADYKNMTSHMGLVRCLERTGRTAEAAQQRKIAEELLGQTP